MKVQWYISDGSAEWAKEAGKLLGLSAGAFADRLIRYHAGMLDEGECAVFVHALEAAQDTVSVYWEDE